MSVECTSCGHLIPTGQFRCGKCGALSPRQSMEDFAGLTEVVADPVVPKGTFASEAPAPQAGASAAATPPNGESVTEGRTSSPPADVRAASARDASEPLPARGPAASTSQRIQRTPTRPPFLASESLREDLTPLEPEPEALARALLGAAAVGFVANVLVAFDHVVGWLFAALCVALGAVARLRVTYMTRARMAAGAAGVGLAAVVGMRLSRGAPPTDALLVAACAVLPAALLFRSWYRAARAARLGVAAALILAFAWCALTSHRGLLALEFSWQSWVPALAWYVFGILCLLSLLAFMGDETTGGCHAWAAGISGWFGLYACLRWGLERAAAKGPLTSINAALGLTEAVLACVFAVALAQVCARLFVARSRVIPRSS
jgi:hypothetical protein